MTAADYEVLGTVIARAVLAATKPLLAKMAELEARTLLPGPAGPIGPEGAMGKDGAPGRDGLPGVPGRPGDRGLDGKDGMPGRHGLDGHDGVDGKDGAPGLHGKDGRDGLNGKDGTDGLGFEDLTFGKDDRGRLTAKFVRGDRTQEAVIPGRLYHGPYEPGKSYETGDSVTWDGSEWTAMAPTKARPGAGATPWILSVKRGREGKPGKDGKDGGES